MIPSVVVYDCMVFYVFAFGGIVASGGVGGYEGGEYRCDEDECSDYAPFFYFGCLHSF